VRLGRGVLFENNFASALRALTQDGGYVEPAVPLLEFLPGSAISHYGRAIRARRFARGDVLVREGEPVESCYVVRSGVLRLLKDLPEGRGAVEIGRHGEGALIGEIGLLTDRTGYASAEALSEVEVDEIPDYLLADITDRFPELRRRLENASRQRLLAMTLATAPLFKVVPVGHRPALLRQFEPVQVQAGEAVLEGGEASPGLFLVLLGALVVCRPEEPDEAAAVATLRSGQHFGAAPLLTGEPCRETVIAARTCELAHLPAAGFYRLVADNPVLWRALRGV
jgi:CRP-like cAMP-binding protein